MSMVWRYKCNNKNKDALIDVIYCSHVEMTIPIVYYFTVLLKDKREYYLTDPKLIGVLEDPIDFNAILDAKSNLYKLQSK